MVVTSSATSNCGPTPWAGSPAGGGSASASSKAAGQPHGCGYAGASPRHQHPNGTACHPNCLVGTNLSACSPQWPSPVPGAESE